MTKATVLDEHDLRWVCVSLLKAAHATTPFGSPQLVELLDHNRSSVCYEILNRIVAQHEGLFNTGDAVAEEKVLSTR